MIGLDLNNMLPGQSGSSTKAKEEIKREEIILKDENTTTIPEVQKKESILQILICSKCNSILSVGKKQISSVFSYKMCCPSCKTTYVKKNYVVDTNSKLWHRPFTKKAQVEFDKEISKLKTQLKYEEITLNNK